MHWIIRSVIAAAIALPTCVLGQSCPQQRLKSPNGPGVMVDVACNRYEGEFLNGRLHGRGKITRHNGDTEDGIFQNGYLSGAGVLSRPDGVRQEGIFVNGSLRSGRYRDEHGVISEGVFPYARQIRGFGIRTWPDGTKLVGEFRNGRPAGPMHVEWPDGTVEKRTYEISGGRDTKPVPGESLPTVAAPRPAAAPQQPAAAPARPPQQTDSGSGPSPGQVGNEINRAIRDLKSIFGR